MIQIVSLSAPNLQDNSADADRLVRALKVELNADFVAIDLHLLRRLPRLLRESDFTVTCVLCKDRGRWILIDVIPANNTPPPAGLAIDLGTTTVVLRLVDLASSDVLAESSFQNPQIAIGPDVLTRIHSADRQNGPAKLNDLIITALNQNIRMLCDDAGQNPEQIYLLCVAGNTVMTHFFMGLDPHWIIREPYIPVVNSPGLLKAHDLGIRVNPLARTLIFPNIGSYFGGDLIAGILFADIDEKKETALLVDVGTNAEVVLGNQDWLIACAGAAGPALEGGVTRIGMMAGPGVIDQIDIKADSLEFNVHTIGDSPPRGICGSGLIELGAHLFLAGMIDIRAKFVPSRCGPKLKIIDGIPHLVIVPADQSATGRELVISQTDLDSLIRSKAAMYTILETITTSVGMSLKNIGAFYVAGTFGSFIKPAAAITIGMLPDLPLDCYTVLGNSSLGGATRALITPDSLERIDRIRDRVTYLELNVNQDFMNRFSAARFLPHTDLSRFPSVTELSDG